MLLLEIVLAVIIVFAWFIIGSYYIALQVQEESGKKDITEKDVEIYFENHQLETFFAPGPIGWLLILFNI